MSKSEERDGTSIADIRAARACLPANLASAKDHHSLGMQLISDLGRQLQGSLEWESVVGTRFTLTFMPRKSGREAGDG